MARKMKTMDGNHAAAHASYAYSDVAAIYPITPSSVMAEATDEWATQGRKNIFGQEVQVTEMQSEAGAAGAVHGSLAAGALTTTYTASQGLLLMIPNLYKIAGEQLPGVFNVSARALASHALSIFGDHSDVYACRQTGCAMLCESSVQEVMDLTPVAHLAAIKGKVPFINFFDGFRTSHEIQKIETWDYEDLKDMADMDAIAEFRKHALNPNHPCQRGSAQNPDIFFQAREACNPYYDALPAIVQEYMDKVNAKLGTDYKLFNYYGAADAEHVIIAMGSVNDTIEETIDYLTKQGKKVGVVKVRLYRPFCAQALIDAIPETVKTISVLDRTKEPGAIGEPLYLDVVAALKGSKFDQVKILTGRYGLGSKDTTPAQIVAVYENEAKTPFTIGIVDDVTNLSLEIGAPLVTTPEGTTNCKFWGLGADGTVGANKNSIKIIGDNTDMYAQAYFAYDSKKSGGITNSHLRFGKSPIRSPYLINTADFVACHQQAYLKKYDMTSNLKDGGSFLLNTVWSDEELDKHLPANVKRDLANKNINFYTINAVKIGKELGLGSKFNMVLQSAFFMITEIIPKDDAIKYMKEFIVKSYGKKGEKIVNMNYNAVDAGSTGFHKVEIPASWKDAQDEAAVVDSNRPEFVKNIVDVMNAQKGDTLPVSAFKNIEDGTFENGTAAYEKRGIAINVPTWEPTTCLQCNQCAFVCPHACIRPFLLTEEEANNAPATVKMADGKGKEAGYKYVMQVSVMDCTGCGNCVASCPMAAKENAPIKMIAFDDEAAKQAEAWDYTIALPAKANPEDKFTVKGSQFEQPLLEFSGSCGGCAETAYARLITQLFGDRMYIANATGCSSIWGGSAPTTPYTTNSEGHGPAWCNSLFEDNAEFGLGMFKGVQHQREILKGHVEAIAESDHAEAAAAAKAWLDTYNDGEASKATSAALLAAVQGAGCEHCQYVVDHKDMLVKKSQWIFGGDGWSYDIGFGGVDHVLASDNDVNVFVFDTEVYSNTGGQASKATPAAAIAKFAAAGKRVRKKDLGMIAKSYGYVYVAQVCMGADKAQLIKALKEAEAYNGPSLIMAYSPCINHGFRGNFHTEAQKAVDCGYWQLYRYNPTDEKFTLDSKEAKTDFKEFISAEVRYSSLKRAFPDIAEELFDKCAADAKRRYEGYKKLAEECK